MYIDTDEWQMNTYFKVLGVHLIYVNLYHEISANDLRSAISKTNQMYLKHLQVYQVTPFQKLGPCIDYK